MPSSCSSFLIAARLTPSWFFSSTSLFSPVIINGWEQQVFVKQFGKVIFSNERCCNKSFPSLLNKNTLNARCSLPVPWFTLSLMFILAHKCPSFLEIGPICFCFVFCFFLRVCVCFVLLCILYFVVFSLFCNVKLCFVLFYVCIFLDVFVNERS